jgi:predicted nucleotidyltransferase component of viral defense system
VDVRTYPTSVAELAAWRSEHSTTAEEARRRLVQFVVLASISSTATLVSRIAFKGGNALRFIHGNPRSTLDLDFSAEGDFPDSSEEIKKLLDVALKTAERRYEVKARCQSIHRKPPGHDKTMPTYCIKVCYQFLGDKHYQNFEERKSFSEVVEVEISLNDVPCKVDERVLHSSAKPLRVCTLDDIIAEKLRALLQQVPRNRFRPQDVFDIASMVRRHGDTMDLDNISIFLIKKSETRGIVATKSAFGESVREKAAFNYEAEIRGFTTEFIPFAEAWAEVLSLVAKLRIAE